MSKQEEIDQQGQGVLVSTLSSRYFLIESLGGNKSNYPDIDGVIQLKDSNGIRLNKYLFYQLKSKEHVKNGKYYCERPFIEYWGKTNIPTVLIVVDITDEKVYWHYLDNNGAKKLIRDLDQKGITFDLNAQEITRKNSHEVNAIWETFANRTNLKESQDALAEVSDEFEQNLSDFIGLLCLLQRSEKNQVIETFGSILRIEKQEIEFILSRLQKQNLILATRNFYLVENDQLGRKSLGELLHKLDLDSVYGTFPEQKDRIIILKQLARTGTEESISFLKKLSKEIQREIKQAVDNDEIYEKLELLTAFTHAVPNISLSVVRAIINCNNPLPAKKIQVEGWIAFDGKSQNDLLLSCCNILKEIRYLRAKEVFLLLLKLRQSGNDTVKEQTTTAISNLIEFDIHVLRAIGYHAQLIVIQELGKWNVRKLKQNAGVVIEICRHLLTPSFGGSMMKDYETVEVSLGALPASNELKGIREKAISILEKLYSTGKEIDIQKKVLEALHKASQTSVRGKYSDKEEQMVRQNVTSLVKFYIEIQPEADNQIISEIENHCRWFEKRFKRIARIKELKSKIAANSDYGMFKIFVGYDRNFGEDDWHDAERKRKQAIQEFIDGINLKNLPQWLKRIQSLIGKYPATKNRDEFQYFNMFLEKLGKQKPEVAFELFKRLEELLGDFSLYLLGGIWQTESKDDVRNILLEWIEKGKNLFISTGLLIFTKTLDIDLLNRICRKATENKDTATLTHIVTALSINDDGSEDIKKLFLKVIKEQTKNKDSSWVDGIWFMNRTIISSLDEKECDVVLRNLLDANQIKHEMEDIIAPIAERFPQKVIQWFYRRVNRRHESRGEEGIYGDYDAIPFQMPVLREPLVKHAKGYLPELLAWFRKKSWHIRWDAGRLIRAIFMGYNEDLEKAILSVIRKKEPYAPDMVLFIVEMFEGKPYLYGVCKELIKKYPLDKKLKGSLFIKLFSTGVVSGEYGFVDALQKKLGSIEDWKKDRIKKVREFALEYEQFLLERIEAEKDRADEDVALRKRDVG